MASPEHAPDWFADFQASWLPPFNPPPWRSRVIVIAPRQVIDVRATVRVLDADGAAAVEPISQSKKG